MNICPICESEVSDEMVRCRCGYRFDSNEIDGIVSIPVDSDWIKNISIKKRVLELYQSKGWSLTNVAKLKFKKSKASLSLDVTLFEALSKFPELRNCKTKGEASKNLLLMKETPNKRTVLSDFKQESELRDFLINNWERTSLSSEWSLKNWEYPTKEVGDIDLLAHHKTDEKWLVIELKLLWASDQAIGQVLRYMGWVKVHLADDKDKVEGLIISKNVALGLHYASLCIPDIRLKIYTFENNELKLKDYNYREELVDQLTAEECEKLIEKVGRLLKTRGKERGQNYQNTL